MVSLRIVFRINSFYVVYFEISFLHKLQNKSVHKLAKVLWSQSQWDNVFDDKIATLNQKNSNKQKGRKEIEVKQHFGWSLTT